MIRDNDASAPHPEDLPPPIGLHYERPRTTSEALKQAFDQDPDYARWVLFRSEELMQRLDTWYRSGHDPRDTDIKEAIAALLLEGRDLLEAIRINKELAALFVTESQIPE